MERRSLGLIRGTFQAFGQRYSGNLKEISVGIYGPRAKIGTADQADKRNLRHSFCFCSITLLVKCAILVLV
jgi:hypothetical protein